MLHFLKSTKQLTKIRRQVSVFSRNFSGQWEGSGGVLTINKPTDIPGHLPVKDDHHDDHHDEHPAVKEHDDHGDEHDDHAHHHKEYDWRDDPKYNKDLYYDIRDRGWDPAKYTFPYQGRDVWNLPFPPTTVNMDDVTLNMRPENKKYLVNAPDTMRASYWDPDNDMAHEFDYESEDLDFQPEDFKTQHFKKKGPIWPWFIAGFTWHIYFWLEFLYQHYPDEDHWRVPRPPPLDYPDADDTDDTDSYKDEFTEDGRYWRETGIVTDIWYDIVDGKKVIRRFGGANQPMPYV